MNVFNYIIVQAVVLVEPSLSLQRLSSSCLIAMNVVVNLGSLCNVTDPFLLKMINNDN